MVIKLEKAVRGFNLHMSAEGLSIHTIEDYNRTLDRFVQFTTGHWTDLCNSRGQ
jgi:hypothetical protein